MTIIVNKGERSSKGEREMDGEIQGNQEYQGAISTHPHLLSRVNVNFM